MLRSLVLLTFAAAAVQGSGWTVPKLLVRFGLNLLQIGSEYYKAIPLSLSEAIEDGWTVYTPKSYPDGLESLVLYCPKDLDLTVCAYYDDTGYIAGLQFAFDKDCVYDPAYDTAEQGYEDWQVTLSNGTVKEYYATAQYFVSADYLKKSSTTRVSNRLTTTILQDTSVWVKGFSGDLYNISTDVSESTASSSVYTEQACLLFMGHHWYYNMSSTTECTAKTIFPWFFTTYSNQFVATGKMFFAKNKCDNKWTEKPTKAAVELIVPRGPECMYNETDNGLITIHTYFVDTPYYISCVFE